MDVENDRASIQTRKILFVTKAECGQSNTILALALEASTRHRLQVHIASFPVLKRRVERLSSKLNFHPLDGQGTFETPEAHGLSEQDLPHPPVTQSFAAYDKFQLTFDGESAFCLFLLVWVDGS